MNIQILHSHLTEFLETKATPKKIGECLALCGPSVEKVERYNTDWLYDIEITTNRVDTASVIGIAREANAILPQFNLSSKLNLPTVKMPNEVVSKPIKFSVKTNPKLNKRVMAAIIDLPEKYGSIKSPKWLSERLEAAGIRSLNLLVDITNYAMLETGHPTHVFDYDKITTHKLMFRLSKPHEKVTTFDGKTYTLPGNDIVIDDGEGQIIDLPGIIGTKNSVVGPSTSRIIFFIDNNDPLLMRKTSLKLGIRTMAVQLNEKSVDPELAQLALLRGIELYTKLAKGKIVGKIIDIYPHPYQPKTIELTEQFIFSRLGVEVSLPKIQQILTALGFEVTATKKSGLLKVSVPSFRATDVSIAEDIVEEISRVYGYHNFPSEVMIGKLPAKLTNSPFDFEKKVKTFLTGWGGNEIYTYSLVPKEMAGENALRLKNPLGSETEYLRTSLKPSLIVASQQNQRETQPVHLFEMANVYLPRSNNLPEEKMMLAGIFVNYDYRHAKGILEALLETLHISSSHLADSLSLVGNSYYYECDMESLQSQYKQFEKYKPIPKYPPQIEDLTFIVPQETKVADIFTSIKRVDQAISLVELKDIYKDSYTFRVWYQHPDKTYTDREVEKIREKIIKEIGKKHRAQIKG